MIRRHVSFQSGFGLIELMIALVIGLLVSLGVLVMFEAHGRAAKTASALANLQESVRVLESIIGRELRMTRFLGCSSVNLRYGLTAPLEPLGTMKTPPNQWAAYSTGSTLYPIGAAGFLNGSSCSGNVCTPAIPALEGRLSLPAVGSAAGDRAGDSDVLVVRYVEGSGATLAADMSSPSADVPLGSATSGYRSGSHALISDCESADIFTVTAVDSGGLKHGTARNFSPSLSHAYRSDALTRVYRIGADLNEHVYYVQYEDDPSGNGVVGVLYRAENGVAQPFMTGVDRLRVRYEVDTGSGVRRVLAADVAAAGGWGRVRGVEVSVLLNSVNRVTHAPTSISFDGATVDLAAAYGDDQRARMATQFYVNLRNAQ